MEELQHFIQKCEDDDSVVDTKELNTMLGREEIIYIIPPGFIFMNSSEGTLHDSFSSDAQHVAHSICIEFGEGLVNVHDPLDAAGWI